jgi:hypothetical protein
VAGSDVSDARLGRNAAGNEQGANSSRRGWRRNGDERSGVHCSRCLKHTARINAPIAAAIATALAAVLVVGVMLQSSISRPTPSRQIQFSSQITPIPADRPPATAVADASSQSSPIECLRNASKPFKEMDQAGVEQCLLLGDDDTSRLMRLGIQIDIAQIRVEKLMLDVFGSDTRVVRFVSMTPDTVVDEVIKSIKPADIHINGDRAVINLRLSQGLIANMGLPSVAELLAWPLHFVRGADGNWRLDVSKSLAFVTTDPEGRVFLIDAKSTQGFLEATLAAADAVVNGIQRGQLTDDELAADRFQRTLTDEKERKGLSELNQISAFPKAVAAKFAKSAS